MCGSWAGDAVNLATCLALPAVALLVRELFRVPRPSASSTNQAGFTKDAGISRHLLGWVVVLPASPQEDENGTGYQGQEGQAADDAADNGSSVVAVFLLTTGVAARPATGGIGCGCDSLGDYGSRDGDDSGVCGGCGRGSGLWGGGAGIRGG